MAAFIILHNLLLYALYSCILRGSLLKKCDLKSLCFFLIDIRIAFEIQGYSSRFFFCFEAFRNGKCLSVIERSFSAMLFIFLLTSSVIRPLKSICEISLTEDSLLKFVKSLKYLGSLEVGKLLANEQKIGK